MTTGSLPLALFRVSSLTRLMAPGVYPLLPLTFRRIVSGFSQPSVVGTVAAGEVLSSGEYEGVAKRATLFFLDSSALPCLGFVGAGKKWFCIKPVTEDPHVV